MFNKVVLIGAGAYGGLYAVERLLYTPARKVRPLTVYGCVILIPLRLTVIVYFFPEGTLVVMGMPPAPPHTTLTHTRSWYRRGGVASNCESTPRCSSRACLGN